MEPAPNDDERERAGSSFEGNRVPRVLGDEGATRVAASDGRRREKEIPAVGGEPGESRVVESSSGYWSPSTVCEDKPRDTVSHDRLVLFILSIFIYLFILGAIGGRNSRDGRRERTLLTVMTVIGNGRASGGMAIVLMFGGGKGGGSSQCLAGPGRPHAGGRDGGIPSFLLSFGLASPFLPVSVLIADGPVRNGKQLLPVRVLLCCAVLCCAVRNVRCDAAGEVRRGVGWLVVFSWKSRYARRYGGERGRESRTIRRLRRRIRSRRCTEEGEDCSSRILLLGAQKGAIRVQRCGLIENIYQSARALSRTAPSPLGCAPHLKLPPAMIRERDGWQLR